MNAMKVRGFAALTAMAMFAFSGSALATNGYFTHGVGAQSKSMAGSGVGSNENMGPIIGASNPALTVFAADDWEVGLSFFSPRRSYVASPSLANGNGGAFTIGSGEYDSSSEWFPIPYLAKNWKLANDKTLTFMFYGRGGMNTDWDDPNATASYDPNGQAGAGVTFPGTFGAGKAGVDLSQAFLSLNYAGMTSDKFAWGIGPVLAFQVFEAKGVASFTGFTHTFASSILSGGGPVPVPTLTDNGHDTSVGWGVAGGIWAGLSDSVSVGLAYQSKMSMGEFDDYADLFAEDGGFDIPSSIKAGISFVASDALRVNFDIEHIGYSDIDSVANPLVNMIGCPTAGQGGTNLENCLGGSAGAGFGWDDMTAYKLGFAWNADDTNTWRFGYSYGEQPIQPADVLFNILAPGVMEQHFTFGWSSERANGGLLTLALMYAPETKVTGGNLFDPTQTIQLKMNQFEFEVAYRF
ncbi:MAG: OmpP1/FadL family transporter [Woeseiaceae bacterium]